MGKRILAIVLGAFVAFGLVALIEIVGHKVYPPPEGLDFADPEAMQVFVDSLPVGAFLFVLSAWGLATLGGGIVAGMIGKEQNLALVIGVLIMIASVINLFMITHPLWFSIVAVIAIISLTLLARSMVGLLLARAK